MTLSGAQELRRPSIFLVSAFWVVIALFAFMVVRWPDNFFADDSYFYFQVAWNIARGFGSTFNNVIPTNGYHPLWMLVCVAVFKLIPGKAAAVHGIGAAITFFNCACLSIMSRLVSRTAEGMWWAAFFLYIPFSFLSQLGTEGALSGAFLTSLGLATYELCRAPTGARAFLFALCGAFAVLSRLDNIFVVGLIFVAVFFSAPLDLRPAIRRYLLRCIPVYAVLWIAYVGSNLHWFGTVQPISGMLKAHPHGEGNVHIHPPHIMLLGLGIILPSILFLSRFRRDTFFRVFELPFAAGVIVHALYITLVMSSETRWSWYYTSWMVLSSILLSRVASVVLAGRRDTIRVALATVTLVLLAGAWFGIDYRKNDHALLRTRGDGYQENMGDRAHLHTVLAWDKPGRIAYYSDVRVVALDGLMGDVKFQRELANRGIVAFDSENHIDGFVGPPMPLDLDLKGSMCDQIYLSSVRFHCVPAGVGEWTVDRVEVFARLTGTSAGSLDLPPQNLVWNAPADVAVWKLP